MELFGPKSFVTIILFEKLNSIILAFLIFVRGLYELSKSFNTLLYSFIEKNYLD